jgi:hypothetical protein
MPLYVRSQNLQWPPQSSSNNAVDASEEALVAATIVFISRDLEYGFEQAPSQYSTMHDLELIRNRSSPWEKERGARIPAASLSLCNKR